MQNEWYEYDEEGDVLDVYFDDKRPAWTVELTPNIMISIDRSEQKAVSLTLMDYMVLIHHTNWGPRSFPITGLANMLLQERELVVSIINSPPVSQWLDISSVQLLPDSPFAVTHLEAPPESLAGLVPLPMAA